MTTVVLCFVIGIGRAPHVAKRIHDKTHHSTKSLQHLFPHYICAHVITACHDCQITIALAYILGGDNQ